jgi:murein DD-endopeptidase MepM/ murein hydrolase activator NlpD
LLFAGGCLDDEKTKEKVAKFMSALYTQWLYEEEYDALWNKSTAAFQMKFGNVENFAANGQVISTQLGPETQVIDERMFFVQGIYVYDRAAYFQEPPIPISIEWGLDDAMNIVWFDINQLPEEASTQFSDYHTKTELRLPFDNEWLVIWGGHSIRDNYHATVSNQRFAYDFLIVENGLPYHGDGSLNEDYYCYGQPIVSPGAGVVVTSENTVPDNPPGEQNLTQPNGNYVVIDHENGEYSFLAHFRKGTVTVHPGDRVTAGMLLGQCGNSGGTDIPHLHYHLQNTSNVDDTSKAAGLPIQFKAYFVDGCFLEQGEPTKWQLVQSK